MNIKQCAFAILLTGLLFQASGLRAAVIPEVLQLRPAQYEVRIEKSVLIKMRDGIRLSTDLYFPVLPDAEKNIAKLPVILMRTPYNKNRPKERSVVDARMFASRGFIVAVQDTRGRYESEGKFGIMSGDAEDGYDTVDWLARQPWSNGKVGTYGCSYRGALQPMQARLKHPALAAMIPQAGPGAGLGFVGGVPRYLGIWRGGALELASTFSFVWYAGSKIHYQPPQYLSPEMRAKIAPFFNSAPRMPAINITETLKYLPVIDMVDHYGVPPTDWRDLLSHSFTDPWWNKAAGYFSKQDTVDVPTLGVNSWYDVNVGHTLYRFNLFREKSVSKRSRDNQFVIISPTGHCNSEQATKNTVMGNLNLGDARLGHLEIYLRWFDHWLKGIDNGITKMPHVQYYLMGKNEWRGASAWPLPNTKFTKYYLQSDGSANSRFGSGRLSVDEPAGKAIADKFVYDPATPVPSVIGEKGSIHGGPFGGALDQRDLETRNDILVYTSKSLSRGLEMTGPMEAVLYVSSSARDTDFTVKILDVHPDGRAYNLRAGILRARYRKGFDRQVRMKPGEVYEIHIPLDPTSNYFATNHRIRIEVSSSNFPRFDRNLNTGGNNFDETEWVIAKNQVHHGGNYKSYILLPIIPD